MVVIHFNAKDFFQSYPEVGFYLDSVCRFGVPVFFLLAGYFLKKEFLQKPSRYLSHGFKRLMVPYLAWFLIYNWYYLTQEVQLDSLKSLQKFAYHLFIKGGAGYHLWFLPALYVGSVLITILGKLKPVLIITLSALLYLIGIYFSHFTLAPSWVSRNGLFFAPLFISLGLYLQSNPSVVRLMEKFSLLLLLPGLVLHLFESYLFSKIPQFGLNVSVGLPFLVLGIFGLFNLAFRYYSRFSNLGKLVFGAYLVHVALIYGAQEIVPTPSLQGAIGLIFFTFVLSLLISYILGRIPILKKLVQ